MAKTRPKPQQPLDLVVARAQARKPRPRRRKSDRRSAKERAAAAQAARTRRASDVARAKKQHQFLVGFAELGNIRRTCELTGISRSTFHEWRKAPEFEDLFQSAVEDAVDTLEGEARRRAVDGWDEEVYQMGGFVGTVRRYDSRLMEVLLKGLRPAVYKDRTSVEAKVDADVRHRAVDPTTLTDDELERRLDEAAEKLRALRRFRATTPALPAGLPVIDVEPPS